MPKKKPEEGMAEGTLRELGFGSLVDFALKFPVFQERFREVNEQIEERLSKGATRERIRPSTRLGIRPHVEGSYSVRYIRGETGREWRPAVKKSVRKPVQKIVAGKPEEIEPLVDVFDEKDHFRVVAKLSGVQEKDIRAEVKGDKLVISADTPDRKYHAKCSCQLPPEPSWPS